jgi:hypothetical protein
MTKEEGWTVRRIRQKKCASLLPVAEVYWYITKSTTYAKAI